MSKYKRLKDFLEEKDSTPSATTPPQGKGANPYMPVQKPSKIRVAKDGEKGVEWGKLGGSNVTVADCPLCVPGGQGGVGVSNEAKAPQSLHPKSSGKIRITKEKDGKDFGSLKSPGMEPGNCAPDGKMPEKGVGTTTESTEMERFFEDTKFLNDAEFVQYMLKKKA